MKSKSLFFKLTASIVLLLFVVTDTAAQQKEKMQIQIISQGGRIVNKDTDKRLQRGSTFSKGTPLVLSPRHTKMRVINNRRQVYYAFYSPEYPGYRLRPARRPGGTRDGKCVNLLTINSYFADSLNILGKTLELPVCSGSFQMDELHFFYLRMQCEGEVVNKKLAFRSDTLLIEYADYFQLNGKILSPESVDSVYLVYRDQERRKTTTITPLRLTFLPNDQLVAEVEAFLEMNTELVSKAEKREEVELLILNFYGRVDEDDFIAWLAIHFPDLIDP